MELTTKQLTLLGHSLGINIYHCKLSRLKRDKKLPKEFYRNRFCASPRHDDWESLMELKQLGLMEWGATINETGDIFWFVTDIGKEKFINNFKIHMREE